MKYFFIFVLLIATCSTFTSLAQPSYYFTRQGEKTVGNIEFYPAHLQANGGIKPAYIIYHHQESSTGIKLKADELTAFVLAIDSFTVIKSLKLHPDQKKEVEDLVQVLQRGSINLYLHIGQEGSGKQMHKVERYLLSKAGSNTYVCLYDLDKQKQELATLFEANPRYKELILNGKVNLENISNLVKAFNASL